MVTFQLYHKFYIFSTYLFNKFSAFLYSILSKSQDFKFSNNTASTYILGLQMGKSVPNIIFSEDVLFTKFLSIPNLNKPVPLKSRK